MFNVNCENLGENSEAATVGVLQKKVFLKFLQISLEITRLGVSF